MLRNVLLAILATTVGFAAGYKSYVHIPPPAVIEHALVVAINDQYIAVILVDDRGGTLQRGYANCMSEKPCRDVLDLLVRNDKVEFVAISARTAAQFGTTL